MNDHDRRILDELETSLQYADKHPPHTSPSSAERRSSKSTAAAEFSPPSLGLAVLMTLVLGGLVSVVCENAARSGNLPLIISALLAFPLSGVPLVNYLRARA